MMRGVAAAEYAAGRFVPGAQGIPVHVREIAGPPGAPVVALVHGWIAPGATTWHRTAQALSSRYRVLMVDLPGFGSSPTAGFSITAGADAVAAALAAADCGPAVIAGYSLGGQVAAAIADRHPHHVAGVVLVSAVARDHNGPVLRALLRAVEVAFGPRALRRPAAVRGPLRARRPGLRAVADIVRADPLAVAEAARDAARYDATGALRRLRVPAAVVVSARDQLVAPRSQRRLAALAPRSELIEMAAGHLAPWVRPHRFERSVTEGCDRVVAGLTGA